MEAFDRKKAGLLVVQNLAMPPYDILGLNAGQPGSLTWAVDRINQQLARMAGATSCMRVLNYHHVASRVGTARAFDDKMRLLGQFFIGEPALAELAHAQIGFARALLGLTRKCIVVDLDNTLWGGIVGEVGFEGICLGQNPPGNAYVEFQKTLLGYYNRGMILAINSRNNPEDVFRVLREHPDQILREHHFGCIVVNWEDKAANLVRISEELNIGLDSLVFVDDDPHNCELVRGSLPQVLTLQVPRDVSKINRMLLELNEFDALGLTAEDRQRGQMYAAERSRREIRSNSVDMESFLADLQIRVKVSRADPFSIPRIAQLTQRTNQFNATTRRYSPADVERLAGDKGTRVYAVSASDRFGDSGIVGAAVVCVEGDAWRLDSFLMSCRVLGRRIEDAFLARIATDAAEASALRLVGEVIFTKKNIPARDFYERMGFALVRQEPERTVWEAPASAVSRRMPKSLEIV